MGFLEVVERIRQRVLLEWLDLDPIVEPPPPRADWPQWSDADRRTEFQLRVLSLNAWGTSVCLSVLCVLMFCLCWSLVDRAFKSALPLDATRHDAPWRRH